MKREKPVLSSILDDDIEEGLPLFYFDSVEGILKSIRESSRAHNHLTVPAWGYGI
jgi:hypothetical protein